MPDYIKFPLVLLTVTLISATCLAFINDLTKDRIEAQRRKKEQTAEKLVFPDGTPGETTEVAVERDGETATVEYKEVRAGGSLAGYLIKGRSPGYSSVIEVLVGVSTDFTIKGVTTLFQQETPGLGTRIEEVTSDRTWLLIIAGKKTLARQPGEPKPVPWFTEQFRGLRGDRIALKQDGGSVDGITGATISSRALSDAVRSAVEDLRVALAGGGK